MSWTVAALYFGLAWMLVLPAWNQKSLITLAFFGVAMFPVMVALASMGNPTPRNEYVSMPAVFMGLIGLPVFIIAVISRGMSLRLDYRLRQRDRLGNNSERLH